MPAPGCMLGLIWLYRVCCWSLVAEPAALSVTPYNNYPRIDHSFLTTTNLSDAAPYSRFTLGDHARMGADLGLRFRASKKFDCCFRNREWLLGQHRVTGAVKFDQRDFGMVCHVVPSALWRRQFLL
jgi:hypothetical protein